MTEGEAMSNSKNTTENNSRGQNGCLQNTGRQLCIEPNMHMKDEDSNYGKRRELVQNETSDILDEDGAEVKDEVINEYTGKDEDHGVYKWIVVFSCFLLHVITGLYIEV